MDAAHCAVAMKYLACDAHAWQIKVEKLNGTDAMQAGKSRAASLKPPKIVPRGPKIINDSNAPSAQPITCPFGILGQDEGRLVFVGLCPTKVIVENCTVRFEPQIDVPESCADLKVVLPFVKSFTYNAGCLLNAPEKASVAGKCVYYIPFTPAKAPMSVV